MREDAYDRTALFLGNITQREDIIAEQEAQFDLDSPVFPGIYIDRLNSRQHRFQGRYGEIIAELSTDNLAAGQQISLEVYGQNIYGMPEPPGPRLFPQLEQPVIAQAEGTVYPYWDNLWPDRELPRPADFIYTTVFANFSTGTVQDRIDNINAEYETPTTLFSYSRFFNDSNPSNTDFNIPGFTDVMTNQQRLGLLNYRTGFLATAFFPGITIPDRPFWFSFRYDYQFQTLPGSGSQADPLVGRFRQWSPAGDTGVYTMEVTAGKMDPQILISSIEFSFYLRSDEEGTRQDFTMDLNVDATGTTASLPSTIEISMTGEDDEWLFEFTPTFTQNVNTPTLGSGSRFFYAVKIESIQMGTRLEEFDLNA